MENIKDPLFRFFEREVNVGGKLLADVRRDLADVLQVCVGEKKPTNHHRTMMADLAKGEMMVATKGWKSDGCWFDVCEGLVVSLLLVTG